MVLPALVLRQRAAPSPSHLPSWQPARSMATARQRRRAARMSLSPNVARSTLKKSRLERDRVGPFAKMNQRQARVPETADSKPQQRPGSNDQSRKEQSPLYKALKMQTALAPINYGFRTAVKNKIADVTSFDQFPLSPVVRDSIFSQALPGLTDVVPTPIQRLAIPQLVDKDASKRGGKKNNKARNVEDDDATPRYDQFLLAAETGSGKTLAYLIPAIDAMKREEAADKEEAKRQEEQKAKEHEERMRTRTFEIEPEMPPLSDAGRPRVIILVPTAELVVQIGAKVKALSHTVKYRSGVISSAFTPRRIKNVLFNPAGIDVLVSTPHLLVSIAKTEPYVLSRVSRLILDEADSLLDRSFAPTTMEIVEKTAPSLKQLILCSATIPRSFDSFLRRTYPDIKRLTSPNLHAVPRRVQLGVVDIQKDPYRGNRNLACADVIWSIGKAGERDSAGPFAKYMPHRPKRIIVFVNEREEADEVAQFLRSKGIDAVSFSRDSSARQHEEILSEFTDNPIPPSPDQVQEIQRQRRRDQAIPFILPEQSQPSERRLPDTKVLVTTDIASRGIDTMTVKTVILYHVPHSTIDFIHRLGRLGRMGRRGRGIVLVGKKDRKDVVKEVREGMYRGQALI